MRASPDLTPNFHADQPAQTAAANQPAERLEEMAMGPDSPRGIPPLGDGDGEETSPAGI